MQVPHLAPRRHRRNCVLALLSICLGFTALAPEAAAQNRAPPDFPVPFPWMGDRNPLEFLFGPPNDANLQEIRRVPISLAEERKYGERVFESARQDLRKRRVEVVQHGDDAEYVRQLVRRLGASMQKAKQYPDLRVYVALSDETDAYSFPGGTILVFRGMIEFAESEAALAGVLGHELSHLDRGHQLLPLQRAKLLQANARERGRDPMDQFFRQASLAFSAFMRPFHPEDELEADRDGATWAYEAGYDPREMARLFARMDERNQIANFMPSFLRTHPYNAQRRTAIDEWYEKLPPSEKKLYIGRENLRRRITAAEHRFPE